MIMFSSNVQINFAASDYNPIDKHEIWNMIFMHKLSRDYPVFGSSCLILKIFYWGCTRMKLGQLLLKSTSNWNRKFITSWICLHWIFFNWKGSLWNYGYIILKFVPKHSRARAKPFFALANFPSNSNFGLSLKTSILLLWLT